MVFIWKIYFFTTIMGFLGILGIENVVAQILRMADWELFLASNFQNTKQINFYFLGLKIEIIAFTEKYGYEWSPIDLLFWKKYIHFFFGILSNQKNCVKLKYFFFKLESLNLCTWTIRNLRRRKKKVFFQSSIKYLKRVIIINMH